MHASRRFWCAGLILVALSPATSGAAPRASTLPLTRVRLYETGVGYFERSGAVPAGATTLPVPAGQLDDALKTLVVLGGDVKVSGVAFSSSVSRDMARKLAGLPEDGDTPFSFSELSRSFKGAGVTLTTRAGSFSGRLVEVLEPGEGELERCADAAAKDGKIGPPAAGCGLLERGSLLVLTGAGELRRVASADVLSLRPNEPAARARLDAALDALSQRGAQTRRDLGVLSSTGGKVTLGYVAEAPVWRSTYRIVLERQTVCWGDEAHGLAPTSVAAWGEARPNSLRPRGAARAAPTREGPERSDCKQIGVLGADKAKLQGWALLHNDTDEDWRSVQVDLVNGRPTSFLYPLAAPRYARRELVTPEDQLYSVPQLFDTTVDNLWSGDTGESFGAGGIGLGGGGVVGYGYGAGSGTLGGSHLSTESKELDIGNLAALTPAEGVEAAALFRYTLPSRLALQAHGSALVPFLDTAIKVRQIAWFDTDGEAASSALHVTNDTKQTLPAGTLSVFGDGGFAGESLLPRAKPNQSHLLSYGIDLDVELARDRGAATEEPRLFAFSGTTLEQHYLRRRTEILTLKNRSRSARTVYVQLDVVNNARVQGTPELGRDADNDRTYTVVRVPASQEVTQTLQLEEGRSRKYEFSKLDSRTLRRFSTLPSLPPAQRATLSRAAAQLLRAEVLRGAKPKREVELAQALADVARIRENARILGGVHAKEVDAMAARIVELEANVTQLRSRLAELTSEAEGFVAATKRELGKL